MATLKICKEIFDIFYPIGSYYETSDTNFDPNKASSWYGTWKEDSKGMVLVGMDATQAEFKAINQTGGAKTVTLGIEHIPPHQHTPKYIGKTLNSSAGTASAAGYEANIFNNGKMAVFSQGDGNYVGGGKEHNNLQPYKVVKRWHRTA